MILDKFRNRYSFNFLSFCGWIILILIFLFLIPELYNTYIIGKSDHFWGVAVTYLGILILNLFFYFITLIIYIIESISLKRIINEKYLKNKYINIILVLGIFFSLLPFVILIIYFVLNSI